jgi:hypothetical protein
VRCAAAINTKRPPLRMTVVVLPELCEESIHVLQSLRIAVVDNIVSLVGMSVYVIEGPLCAAGALQASLT